MYENGIAIYGISQYPDTKDYIMVIQDYYCEKCGDQYTKLNYKWCKPCQINNLKQNFANWTSENEKIDNFIQKMQLKISLFNDIIIEWIPYNQFNDIKEMAKVNLATLYSAIWLNGPLKYDKKEEYKRIPNKKVTLECLGNSQKNINEFLSEAINRNDGYDRFKIYGISKNPDTKDYIIVYQDSYCENCGDKYTYGKYCIPCQINDLKQNFANWTSGNEKINEFIQKMQLKFAIHGIVEWIPYNQFNDIKELIKSDSATVYSAIWTNGPLEYNENKWKRIPNKIVSLKRLYNSPNITYKVLNEAKSYFITYHTRIYRISQHPDIKDYIIVLENCYCKKCGNQYTYTYSGSITSICCESCSINDLKQNFANWTSGNEKIDKFIQARQLDIEDHRDMVVEWIPYNQFSNIKEIDESNSSIHYTAIWINGSLKYDYENMEWKRNPNEKVILKCLGNSQNITEFLNKVRICLIEGNSMKNICGISENPDTKNYIIVFQNCFCNGYYSKWCEPCKVDYLKQNFTNWTSGNEKIDNYIQEMQLKIMKYNNVVEWIPYNQFKNITEVSKSSSAIMYSATWINGPLQNIHKKGRIPNKKVTLKCLYNSQNMIIELLNEVKLYSIEKRRDKAEIYGLSQHPDIKDYIIILQGDINCKKCGIQYTDNWCKPCQINGLKQNFKSWTSGNEKIDNFIQEIQLNFTDNIIVEWIPYEQFKNITETNKNDSFIVYSAIWMNGPLKNKKEKNRSPNREVILKCLYNSQNMINEFLYEVKSYFNTNKTKIYGMAQHPNQNFKNWTSGNEMIDNYIQQMQLKIKSNKNKIVEWISYNQFENITEISKSNCDIIYSAIWIDGPLRYDEMEKQEYNRTPNKKVVLKNLYGLQNDVSEFLNEIKKYTISNSNGIPDLYGISQNPNTKDYIIIVQDCYCENCRNIYTNIHERLCSSCQINNIKKNYLFKSSGNENIDNFIQEMQLKIKSYKDIIVEWIPYNQFNSIKEIGKGGFATVYSAIWIDGPLRYKLEEYIRRRNLRVALKHIHNSCNITNKFLNEAKAYSISDGNSWRYKNSILNIYGISQNPDTKNYILVLQYASKGDLSNYKYISKVWSWPERLVVLRNIINGLKIIHNNQMVHHDLHTGNLLLIDNRLTTSYSTGSSIKINRICISDMGLCGEVDNIDETRIYGVMPYVAPEVLKGGPYTQAADIYSFGMIMYFVATKKQPFANCAHDNILALNIYNGIRPEISEKEAPKWYIDLMKRCWDSNPKNRPPANEIEKLIDPYNPVRSKEIVEQIEKAVEYRKANLLSIENNQSTTSTHPLAYYTSRLLNPFTKDLPKYDSNINNSTIEVIDFTLI
ncbi:unnamed protein product [Rhizophagus irregularis]|nr:unnamed protein product [Rhizophagus irregularis]